MLSPVRPNIILYVKIKSAIGWLEFNDPFQHKYAYIRSEKSAINLLRSRLGRFNAFNLAGWLISLKPMNLLVNKYQMSTTNPRDAQHHGKRAANKGGRSV